MNPNSPVYKKKVIKQLYFSSNLSCSELSAAIKKSLPLTTRIVNELISENIVIETGLAASTGGRRAVKYSLKQDVLFVVSVAMDQFITRIAIMDTYNKMVNEVVHFELPLRNNGEALFILTQKVNEVIRLSGIPKEKFIGVGIGMPGFVDIKKGINYTFLKTPNGKSITAHISEETGLPVYIDNDSSLIALAELRFGAARQKENAMVINLGWGVGLGMILNGELFRGKNGFAGEFSHIPIFSNEKLCSCGKTGCLETETSLLVIIEKAREGLRAGRLSVLKPELLEQYEQASETIIEAVLRGDRFAIELFSEAGYNIGRGVAILIHLLNPEVIILSGRGTAAGKVWEAPIQQALNEHCIPGLAVNTVIEMSVQGYVAELIGAAALVMEHYDKETSNTRSKDMSLISVN
jgi:predicted NBD/HSP70 family sugar kinase